MRKSPITHSDCNLLEGDNAAENIVKTKRNLVPLLVLCEVPRNLAWAIASQRNPSQSVLWLTTVLCIQVSTENWPLAECL